MARIQAGCGKNAEEELFGITGGIFGDHPFRILRASAAGETDPDVLQ